MNLLLVSVVLLVGMVGLSSAQRGGRQGGPRGGPGGPHGPHGGGPGGPGGKKRGPPNPFNMFPSCESMNQAMKAKHSEMWQSKLIGPEANNCQANNREECMRKDMTTVRCAVAEQPSQECLEDMMAFMKATACDGTDVGTTDDYEP